MEQKRHVTARVPLRPETQERLRDFCAGLGVTYDEGIDHLLSLVSKSGEEFEAGRTVKQQLESSKPTP